MKYCTKCGYECNDTDRYCPQCGNDLYANASFAKRPILDSGNIQTRSIPVCVILSIVTCGLYLFYWQLKLNTEINYLSGEENAASSGTVMLLTIITCGMYSIYWSYKMGERSDIINGSNRYYSILFLVLQLLALPIVSAVLMQDTINNAI